MVKLAFTFGTLLVLLGIGFFAALSLSEGEMISLTALLPAAFGAALLICGGLATLGAGWRKHAMHAALLIALLGAIGAGMRLPKGIDANGIGHPAVIEQVLMVVLSLAFVALGVRSFIAARVKKG